MSSTQEFFAKHPVFTASEFEAYLNVGKRRSPRTTESLLAHYVRTGRLLRVRRGLYASVPLGGSPERSPVDPYLLACKMADDAVLGYHTALEFHGKAHSAHRQFLFLTRQAPRPLTFRGDMFRGVAFPRALIRKRRESFGVTQSERAGMDLRVTRLERTLVDVLDRPVLGGGWEEIWRSLESVEYFDLDQVVEYALLLGNSTTIAKVGFFLDQHRDRLMVDPKYLQRLSKRRPRQPHYLVRGKRESGRLVPSWQLVVPPRILERSWEETV